MDAQGWRTMDSAPRDRSRFLVCVPNEHGGDWDIVLWLSPLDNPPGFYCETNLLERSYVAQMHEAMWQPLPPPPTKLEP